MCLVPGESAQPQANPVVAVVGATGGLGSALSRELARRGARLVLTGRNPATLQKLSEELPGSASAVLDLHDPDAGDRLVATAAAFVHAASIARRNASDGRCCRACARRRSGADAAEWIEWSLRI